MNLMKWLPGPIQGVASLLVLTVNTVFWTTLLFIITLFKIVVPLAAWRSLCSRVLNWIATSWIFMNNLGIRLTKSVKWDVKGLAGLNLKGYYLVIANHQSWLDIVVLQKIFNRRIPMLKFFLKKELIWVPLLGPAWWALDFPFMKRYSRSFLAKHPHLKGKDLETTRKACEKFRNIPVAIMNFVEGTRFTCEKAMRQESPYTSLLKPKAAGVAFVLGAMGENLERILNVTIAYPKGPRGLWDFMCGKVTEIKVMVDSIPITQEILGDYFQDGEYRERFQIWLNNLWAQKDMTMRALTDQPCLEMSSTGS